jgi:micrococcal nuclease
LQAHLILKRLGQVLILVGLCCLYGQWQVFSKKTPQAHSSSNVCQVLTVFDGDTLGCDMNFNGKLDRPHEMVRLLGIDTPEMHYSKKNKSYKTEASQDEPFAREASQWTKTCLQNQKIALELDQSTHDRYDRTLAYVYLCPKAGACTAKSLSNKSVNQQLLEAGLASVLFIGENRRYESLFVQSERAAQRAQKGIWHQGQ